MTKYGQFFEDFFFLLFGGGQRNGTVFGGKCGVRRMLFFKMKEITACLYT